LNPKIQKIEESIQKNNKRISDCKAKISELQKRNAELEAEKSAAKDDEILAFMRENGKSIDDLKRAFAKRPVSESGGMIHAQRRNESDN
jgi:molecular chaperone GrpE (heat shock protein)